MTQAFEPRALEAFFQEVSDTLHIDLQYHPENERYPIQLASAEGITAEGTSTAEGISRDKCHLLLQFIKTQIDLRDNEIAKLTPSVKSGKFLPEITQEAAHALAEVYALGFFIDTNEDDATS